MHDGKMTVSWGELTIHSNHPTSTDTNAHVTCTKSVRGRTSFSGGCTRECASCNEQCLRCNEQCLRCNEQCVTCCGAGCCGGDAIFDVLLGNSQIGQFTSVTDETWS